MSETFEFFMQITALLMVCGALAMVLGACVAIRKHLLDRLKTNSSGDEPCP